MTKEEQKTRAKSHRTMSGLVRSISGDKTISVTVTTLVKHPRYGKYVRRRTKVAVHDPANTAGVGDVVEIVASRRISKSKSWRLVRVVRRSTAVEAVQGK